MPDSGAYGSILIPLFEEDGLRMSELARRARLSKQTLTTLIPRLERDGLVERRSDPDDRRAVLVFLPHAPAPSHPSPQQCSPDSTTK